MVRPLVIPTSMSDSNDSRTTDCYKQIKGVDNHNKRIDDIDRAYGVLAHATPDKDTVNDCKQEKRYLSDNRRENIL